MLYTDESPPLDTIGITEAGSHECALLVGNLWEGQPANSLKDRFHVRASDEAIQVLPWRARLMRTTRYLRSAGPWRRYPLRVGSLDHGGERLLSHPARLQEAGEVAALVQLRDAQIERARARLPGPVSVAVAIGQGFGGLLQKRLEVHDLIGDRRS